MTRIAWLPLSLAVACGHIPGSPPAPLAPAGMGHSGPRLPDNARDVQKAPIRAVVTAIHVVDECSNAGGVHVIVEPVDRAKGGGIALAHFGGHLFRPPQQIDVGGLFVAGMEATPLGRPDEPGNPGWCLGDLPATNGRVSALIPVSSLAAGEALIARLERESALAAP